MGFWSWLAPPSRSEPDALEALRALASGLNAPVTRRMRRGGPSTDVVREQPRDPETGRFAPGDGTELEQPEWAGMLVEAAEAVKDLGDRVGQIEVARNQGRAVAREAGYTDEGLRELEQFMQDNGVFDHTIAMPAFERANPPPEPIMTGSQRWNFTENPQSQPDLKALFDGNEEAFLGVAIPAAIRHVRGW